MRTIARVANQATGAGDTRDRGVALPVVGPGTARRGQRDRGVAGAPRCGISQWREQRPADPLVVRFVNTLTPATAGYSRVESPQPRFAGARRCRVAQSSGLVGAG
jgi:hypothetical protein